MPGAKAIHDLPHLTWKGNKIWYTSVRTNWAHRLAPRKYLDINGEAHDWTGRDSLRIGVTAVFHSTIEPDLYPAGWSKLRADLLKTAEIGELRHPEIGLFTARPANVAYEISPEKSTAGITVDLEFIESIKSADQPTKFVTASSDAAKSAEEADAAMALMGLDYPDGMWEPSLGEMLDAIASFPATFSHELDGLLNQTIGLVDQMYETVQALSQAQAYLPGADKESLAASPYRWLLESSLNTIRAALAAALAASQSGGQSVLSTIAASDTTLASISLDLGVEVGGLVRLNPNLLKAPKVPKGSKVLYLDA